MSQKSPKGAKYAPENSQPCCKVWKTLYLRLPTILEVWKTMQLAKMSQSMKNWGARLDAAPHLVYRRKSRQKGPCNFSWGLWLSCTKSFSSVSSILTILAVWKTTYLRLPIRLLGFSSWCPLMLYTEELISFVNHQELE